MRVTKVGQENTRQSQGVLKAGAIGALGGAVVRNLAPLTTDEYKLFFNSSAVDAIKGKVKDVRISEANKIVSEIQNGALNVSQEVGDTFVRSANIIAANPDNVKGVVEGASAEVKEGIGALVSRIDAVGAVKQHTEIHSLKSAAKSARPLAYFAVAGALVAMSGKLIVNAFNSLKPKELQQVKEKPEKLTMADVLLDGLGSNTEVLFLTSEAKK